MDRASDCLSARPSRTYSPRSRSPSCLFLRLCSSVSWVTQRGPCVHVSCTVTVYGLIVLTSQCCYRYACTARETFSACWGHMLFVTTRITSWQLRKCQMAFIALAALAMVCTDTHFVTDFWNGTCFLSAGLAVSLPSFVQTNVPRR